MSTPDQSQQRARLLSASALGRELGMSASTVLNLYRAGVIDAEIHEGRLIRFDADKARSLLSERAKQNRGDVANGFPDGMMPTY